MKLMFFNVLMNSSQWLQMLTSSLDFAPIAAPGTNVIGFCVVRIFSSRIHLYLELLLPEATGRARLIRLINVRTPRYVLGVAKLV
ncbi:Uncharacterized protein APZ42_001629 [Daphnia magna]|uniref:Uncharacterized protein n=1 Tax=Daphnia magna TaxID=35525 RepID=A0A164IUW4_9CRUS|nr:Uncharacterized protein APZ42_001629 [Daphnia magna]